MDQNGDASWEASPFCYVIYYKKLYYYERWI